MSDYKNTINLPETPFPMKGDLANREPGMLAQWEAEQRYARLQAHCEGRPLWVLHDGPPYANGEIHIGHALNKILKDIVVRSKIVGGFRSPYVPGWDCHGLPIELVVEKQHGKVGTKLDAKAFREKCREYATQQIDGQRRDFKRLGVLGDWESPYRTMDRRFEADIIRALARIVANGHVARGVKPVHWCFDCGSALAEAEIEYADKTSPAVDVAYDAIDPKTLATQFGADAGDAIVAIPIWTTTPWTLPASLAVTLGPEYDYVLVEGPARGARRQLLVLAESLVDAALARYGVSAKRVLGRAKGTALEHLRLRHPFYAREVPLILGAHVTVDAGTGAVHTAPGHGQEDFAVGQQYGLGVLNPVGANGVFLPETELFAGQHIFKANDAIAAVLAERGVLLANAKLTHSYPHCWRHKTPVAFRTTPQWFVSMEQNGLRKHALGAIHKTRWIPGWGEERIAGMIENRPDWCISRQRTWGVPIALFAKKSDGTPHPDSAKLLHDVADLVERDGVDAWYALDPATLIGTDAAHYDKVTDIFDVWFESGVTHAGVMDARAEFVREPHEPKRVMYLEGSDQHRGWFHSSLLTSTAMSGHAPYSEVLTHGFTVDAQGRKMSKSLGNVVAPQKVVSTLGADVLRLWVASTDYANEISVSDEILKRVADSYRRLRNTARFLIGNLAGFDPAKDLVPIDEMLLLDRWALAQAVRVMQLARRVYGAEAGGNDAFGPDTYRYQTLVQELMRFCTVDMGAAYLDMTKDRLYTLKRDAQARRSAQTAMYWTLEILVRAFAPVLAFTAEEIWAHMPGRKHPTALHATWAELDHLALHAHVPGERGEALFALLAAIRVEAARVLETMRNEGAIGSSLDAEVELFVDEALARELASFGDELRFYFITSTFAVRPIAAAQADALPIAPQGHAMALVVRASDHAKCVRCWHHRVDVGSNAEHPELCGRCVENVAGAGETRRWF